MRKIVRSQLVASIGADAPQNALSATRIARFFPQLVWRDAHSASAAANDQTEKRYSILVIVFIISFII